MPIYEYACEDCGGRFEELVTGDRDRKVPCPACGSTRTRKLMSAIGGISVKGGGPAPACAAGGGCPGMAACGGGCPHG
jgi:putative FmdB family regulatory protein